MSRPIETCHRCGAVESAERVYNGTDSEWVQPGYFLRINLSRHYRVVYLCAACTDQGHAKRLLDRLYKAMNAILAEEADHAHSG